MFIIRFIQSAALFNGWPNIFIAWKKHNNNTYASRWIAFKLEKVYLFYNDLFHWRRRKKRQRKKIKRKLLENDEKITFALKKYYLISAVVVVFRTEFIVENNIFMYTKKPKWIKIKIKVGKGKKKRFTRRNCFEMFVVQIAATDGRNETNQSYKICHILSAQKMFANDGLVLFDLISWTACVRACVCARDRVFMHSDSVSVCVENVCYKDSSNLIKWLSG